MDNTTVYVLQQFGQNSCIAFDTNLSEKQIFTEKNIREFFVSIGLRHFDKKANTNYDFAFYFSHSEVEICVMNKDAKYVEKFHFVKSKSVMSFGLADSKVVQELFDECIYTNAFKTIDGITSEIIGQKQLIEKIRNL